MMANQKILYVINIPKNDNILVAAIHKQQIQAPTYFSIESTGTDEFT